MDSLQLSTIIEEGRKGKGCRCFFGGRIYSIPCLGTGRYFVQDDFEEQDEFILFFRIILVQFILLFKSSSAKQQARQGIEYILPPKQKRRPLPLLLSLSFFYCMPITTVQCTYTVLVNVQPVQARVVCMASNYLNSA